MSTTHCPTTLIVIGLVATFLTTAANERSRHVSSQDVRTNLEISNFIKLATINLFGQTPLKSVIIQNTASDYEDPTTLPSTDTSDNTENSVSPPENQTNSMVSDSDDDLSSSETNNTIDTDSQTSSTSKPSMKPLPPKPVPSELDQINATFNSFFYRQRHKAYEAEKNETRAGIVDHFKSLDFEIVKQEFVIRNEPGVNLIGIMPGRYRGTIDDSLILVGGHYDTVEKSPGVEDNGAGSVAVLETARALAPFRNRLNSTILFVLFDLEERGLWGSIAFVREYLVPFELKAKAITFVGAFIADMVLTWDQTPNSQRIPADVAAVSSSINFYDHHHISRWKRHFPK